MKSGFNLNQRNPQIHVKFVASFFLPLKSAFLRHDL